MPNVVKVAQRSLEIIAQRYTRVMQELEEAAAEAEKLQGPSQEQKRAAYDVVRMSATPEAYVAARQAFDAEVGPDEYNYQETLGLRRQEKQGQS